MSNRDAKGNWRPDTLIKLPPFYAWPPRPRAVLKWFAGFPGYLYPLNALIVLISVVTWTLLTPDPAQMKTFAFWWVGLLLLRNVFIAAAFFGGLHIYLYVLKKQGDKLEFSTRSFAKKNKRFLFSDQLRDNLFRTFVYAVPILTAYEAVTYWLFANGFNGLFSFTDSTAGFWLWFVVLLLFMPVIHATHFYFTHRLLHSRVLYMSVHRVHHYNIEVGPFSGLAMHPVELTIYFSTVCLQWILALHPLNALCQLQFALFSAAMSHTGYEKILLTDDVGIDSSSYFHYLHHKYFECNYGGTIAPMDQLFGTFHDGSMEAEERMRQRMRQRIGANE